MKFTIGPHDPILTGWDAEVTADGVPKHRPSEILKRGCLASYQVTVTKTSG